MLSKRSFGIAGAAMLGTVALLGTNAANAAIDLDATDKSDPAATYAQETVTMEVDSDIDGTYYEVGDGTLNVLDIHGEIGEGAVQDETLVVTFTLTGMVWGADMADESLRVHASSTAIPAAAAPTDDNATNLVFDAGERVLNGGGGSGENTAVFHVSNGDGTIPQDAILYLDVATLGVSADGGSVAVHVRHELGSESTSQYMNAVALARGVTETGTPRNPVTEVARGYTDFGLSDASPPAPITEDSVGSFSVGVAGHLNAVGSTTATAAEVFGVRATADVDVDAARDNDTLVFALEEAMVQFEGTTGFAESVWLDDSVNCDRTVGTDIARDLVDTDSDGNNNGKLVPVSLSEVSTPSHLCIGVPDPAGDDAMAIPATGAFNGKTTYAGIADALIPPMGTDTALGGIVRDGVSVWLPYLTTDERYRQRIIMVNNSDTDAAYMMEFVSEAGVTVTEGADSSGTLPAGWTTVLHLTNDDVMTTSGGANRAAALLVIEAEPGDISVATNQTNFMTGGTDTVVYTEELTR